MRRTALPKLAAAAALAVATWAAASRLPAVAERPYDVPVLPPAGVVRWLSLGHPTLAANVFWLRTVQYIGEPRGDERGWERLFPLVDLVTDLDPGHGYAYQVAGTMLSAVGRVDESNRILEKGMRNVPDRYILPYNRAFNAFYYDLDFEEAGRFVELAARTPGAPPHLAQSVLAYYVKGNRSDLALQYLEHALAQAEDDESRKALEGQLLQARVEAAAAIVDEAAARYREARGFPPLAVHQLVAEGFLAALPGDPAGGEWLLGADGRARSSAHERRIGRAPRRDELPAIPQVSLPPGLPR